MCHESDREFAGWVQLVPLVADRLAELERDGQLRPARRALRDLGEPAPRTRSERSLSEVLREMRRDERD